MLLNIVWGCIEVGIEWNTLRYSTKRLRKATKCSALRIFPGTASFRRSSGRARNIINAHSPSLKEEMLTWI
jgi:hypothetical protein